MKKKKPRPPELSHPWKGPSYRKVQKWIRRKKETEGIKNLEV